MNPLDLVRQSIEARLAVLTTSLDQARIAQRNAPSAMESHSDTTRSEMERMVTALEIDINTLKTQLAKMVDLVKSNKQIVEIGRITKINTAGQDMEIIIVPEGLGGDLVEGIRLVSEASPLSQAILGKKLNEEIKMGESRIKILAIQ